MGKLSESTSTRLIPPGGTSGQILAKSSNSDFARQWVDPPAAGGSYAGSYAKSSLPTVGVTSGALAKQTDRTRGFVRYDGTKWIPVAPGNEISILDFVTDPAAANNAAGIQAAIDEAHNMGGATIVFPADYTIKFTAPINVNSKYNIAFRGTNSGRHQSAKVNLQYDGTGTASAISALSALAFTCRNMHFSYTQSGFTGKFIEFGHDVSGVDSIGEVFMDCYFDASPDVRSAACFLDFGHAINSYVIGCGFKNAIKMIIGNSGAKNFSNNIRVMDCSFNDYVDYAIWNPNANWKIEGNDFAPSVSGAMKAIGFDGTVVATTGRIIGNYLGDTYGWSADPAIKLSNCYGFTVHSNWATINTTATFIGLYGSTAISIADNYVLDNGENPQPFVPSDVSAGNDTISLVVGAGEEPASIGTNVRVQFGTTGTLPGGLTGGTDYYCLIQGNLSDRLIKVSATPGGAAVNLTDGGNGTHSIYVMPQATGVYFDGGTSRFSVRNNALRVINPIASARVAHTAFIQGNTTVGGVDVPDMIPAGMKFGTNEGQKIDPSPNYWSVAVGLANDIKTIKGYGAAVRQVTSSTEGRPQGDLVIQAATHAEAANAGIDLVVGQNAESGLYLNSSGARSSLPLAVKGRRSVVVPVATDTDFIKASATLEFGTVTSFQTKEVTFTFEGAAVGDVPYMSPPSGLENGLMLGLARVSAPNVVTVRIYNGTNADIASAGRTWNAEIRKVGINLGNYALAANGAEASATSVYSSAPQFAITNPLRGSRAPGIPGQMWHSAANPTVGAPQDYIVDLKQSRSVGRIIVIGVPDVDNRLEEPTEDEISTLYKLIDYTIMKWNGSDYEAIPGLAAITGNDKVYREFEFTPVSMSRYRVRITAAAGGYARIVATEASA